ncbi:histidine kinase, partial [Westiellopsis prolifica IICB1]
MGSVGDKGDKGDKEDKEEFIPMPNAPCPMP